VKTAIVSLTPRMVPGKFRLERRWRPSGPVLDMERPSASPGFAGEPGGAAAARGRSARQKKALAGCGSTARTSRHLAAALEQGRDRGVGDTGLPRHVPSPAGAQDEHGSNTRWRPSVEVVGISHCRTGAVAAVVARANTTIIANSVGLMTPRSRPMFMTISSMSPRVFISVPSAAASRQLKPVSRAATSVPPNLPTVAARMIAAHRFWAWIAARQPGVWP